ncbi:hypothetical protein BGZ97_009876, partial [Linnemannia gamsii]
MLFKFNPAALLVAMASIMMVTRTSAFELLYRRCGGTEVFKTNIDGNTCIFVDDIDSKFCEPMPRGSTTCKRYLDEECQ